MICGLDISTARIGIGIIKGSSLIYRTYTFDKNQSHRQRRYIIVDMLKELKVKSVFVEEVRLFSFGGKSNFINTKTIFRLLAILVTLVDNGIEVYTINARSWKCRILKPSGFDKSKEGSVLYIKSKYGIEVNHDTADSICIAEYGKKYPDMVKRFD